ncbi:MAG: heat shock 70 family protein, partial [Candidatus Bathyarchaeota archaeon]|nr:heat shock 70 family protein [Candidatus Bathyarchaeota archaeon]
DRGIGRFNRGACNFGDLSDVQLEEIKDMVQDMHENGASKEEIKAAVESKLTEWGIEVPKFEQSRLPPWWSELTDEQKEEIITIKEELREAGASKEEIRDAVKTKLEEWNRDSKETNADTPINHQKK